MDTWGRKQWRPLFWLWRSPTSCVRHNTSSRLSSRLTLPIGSLPEADSHAKRHERLPARRAPASENQVFAVGCAEPAPSSTSYLSCAAATCHKRQQAACVRLSMVRGDAGKGLRVTLLIPQERASSSHPGKRPCCPAASPAWWFAILTFDGPLKKNRTHDDR